MKPIRPLIFLFVLCLPFLSCQESRQGNELPVYQKVSGQTMGTTYMVTYLDSLDRNFKSTFDSLLVALNLEVSTYIDTAFISRFNQSDSGLYLTHRDSHLLAPHFTRNLRKAREVYEWSNGRFDPSVMPLVNYWGFGYTPNRQVGQVDSARVDSILRHVGFRAIEVRSDATGKFLYKPHPDYELDFGGIAKGFGVDLLAEFLEDKGVNNYLVEIGREVRANGRNPSGNGWTIGVSLPSEEAGINELFERVQLVDRSIATSGNYRNYYELDGVKYSHTINPLTGFPERNTILSASIFAHECMDADALATACMVIGLPDALHRIEDLDGVDGYFIQGTTDGGMQALYTSGLDSLINH